MNQAPNASPQGNTASTTVPGLPEPLAAREVAPRTRRPLSDLLLPASPAALRTAA
jgi:hypothetical protein